MKRILLFALAALVAFPQISDARKKDSEGLKVMSYNVRQGTAKDGTNSWKYRCPATILMLEEFQPDVFGVQEAFNFQIKFIEENFTDYDSFGVGRDNGKSEGEFMSIFWNKKTVKMIKGGTFWLSETPDEISYGWSSAYRRICNWVILENKYTNTQFVHINTHFDNASSEARRNSIGMILNKAKEFKDLPVVFSGDLNFIEKSLGYRDITADVLKDTKVLAKDTMNSATFHNADPNAFKDIVLDYILINDGFKALKYEVVKEKYNNRYISDHYAVVASVEVVSGQ